MTTPNYNPPTKPSRYFITATDTNVGKTTICAALLLRAEHLGLTAYGVKPVTAGTMTYNGVEYSSDALLIQHCSNVMLSPSLIAPILLPNAIAPHIAAQLCGKTLDASRLVEQVRGVLSTPANVCLVEGAGGWLVPLNQRETMADVVKQLTLPTIVVVGIQLGCLNHALLTVHKIKMDGLAVAGWVANIMLPADTELEARLIQAQIDYLAAHISAPLLGVVGYNPLLINWTVAPDLSEEGFKQSVEYKKLTDIALNCLRLPPELAAAKA